MYRIKELRVDSDLSQKTIAAVIKTTQQHYSKIEAGKADIFRQGLSPVSALFPRFQDSQ